MRERWRKDEKGKWEDHRLNTGIMINTYRYIQYVSDMYVSGRVYIYIYSLFVLLCFSVWGSFPCYLAAWKNL